MRLWPRLARDFARLRAGKKRAFLPALFDAALFDNGFQAVVTYRMSHALKSWGVPLLPAVCRRLGNIFCGVDLAPRAQIGGGLILPHGLGVVIGSDTHIGVDCTMLHGVTLGEARFDSSACPRIGDRVTIGAGAQVLGPVEVGDDATIAAGAIVLDSVAAGATVAGVPARPVTPP